MVHIYFNFPICMVSYLFLFLNMEKMMFDIFLATLTMASCGFILCLYDA